MKWKFLAFFFFWGGGGRRRHRIRRLRYTFTGHLPEILPHTKRTLHSVIDDNKWQDFFNFVGGIVHLFVDFFMSKIWFIPQGQNAVQPCCFTKIYNTEKCQAHFVRNLSLSLSLANALHIHLDQERICPLSCDSILGPKKKKMYVIMKDSDSFPLSFT